MIDKFLIIDPTKVRPPYPNANCNMQSVEASDLLLLALIIIPPVLLMIYVLIYERDKDLTDVIK